MNWNEVCEKLRAEQEERRRQEQEYRRAENQLNWLLATITIISFGICGLYCWVNWK